ncbi:MAG TPA: ATP-binding protein [Anaerolineae bacterium]|nr:ATP-binding protein [Anaerolineae bacterium]
MIKEFDLEDCGPIDDIHWNVSPHINLVIGKNGTGKSLILKMLYVVLRSIESYGRGDSTDSFKSIVGEKLRGTFQIDQVGNLVRKGGDRLRIECQLDDQKISFSFSSSAIRGVGDVSKIVQPSTSLSLFIPPKEILSLTQIIRRSRLQDQLLGFDDTYLDLTIALDGEPQKGRTSDNLANARKKLSNLFNGRLEKTGDGSWLFREGNAKYSIHITAEGIKRLVLIDRLISNRSLKPGSVLFIDEPEAMLHPNAIVEFMEILHLLAKQNIQIFLASHSYFVLKALYVIAKRDQVDIQVLSLTEDGKADTAVSLKNGMPDNPIIDESIAIYEREIDLAL